MSIANKFRYINILPYMFLFFLLTACKKESLFDCLKGSGKTITEERIVDDFTKIEVKNIFNIYLLQDTITKVRIKGGKNLLPLITTKVKNGTLFLDDENTCRWSRDYERIEMYITVHHLDEITLSEPCYISSKDTIYGDNIEILALAYMNEGDLHLHYNYIYFVSSHTAGGKLTLAGNVNRAKIVTFNSIHVDAIHLVSSHAELYSKSIGDIYIYCTEKLYAEILNSGNIYYKGNPAHTDSIITGEGQLITLD